MTGIGDGLKKWGRELPKRSNRTRYHLAAVPVPIFSTHRTHRKRPNTGSPLPFVVSLNSLGPLLIR